MDKILEEMEAVMKDLEGGKLNEQTLHHEERILSRLLDAQRSVRSRDYERKRESLTARNVFSKGSGGESGEKNRQGTARGNQARNEVKGTGRIRKTHQELFSGTGRGAVDPGRRFELKPVLYYID